LKTTTLGKTGLKVSRLGAGLGEIGLLSDASHAGQVLNLALDHGINFLDTAACYGKSEEWIGRTISHRRSEYILATKAGHIVEGLHGEEWTAPLILNSIEQSLKRMKTDYLDLVQLHSCEIDVLERGQVIQALLEAKQDGKTRYIGYSGDGDAALWAIESRQFDTLQVTFNLIHQEAAQEVIPEAEANHMGIIIKHPIANAIWGTQVSTGSAPNWNQQKSQAMLDMGPIPGMPDDSILLALGFILAHEEVDTAIVGTSNPEHMRSNIELVEKELPITAEVVRELHRRFERLN
jgi:aryl-alcohol dehydrogenase-like predicted oxidoreductase